MPEIDWPDLLLLDWRAVVRPPTLSAAGLHVWRLAPRPAGLPENPAADLALLDARERERAARLRCASARRAYRQVHADCRRVLAGYLDLAPAEVRFAIGAHGKPSLAQCRQPRWEINLTASGELALLAVSLGEPVGIDCEWPRPGIDALAIARRLFDPTEQAELARADSEPARQQLFLRHWTALEARVKRDGRGLTGHRQPDPPGLCIAHARPAPGSLCAIARVALPPPADWTPLLWHGHD